MMKLLEKKIFVAVVIIFNYNAVVIDEHPNVLLSQERELCCKKRSKKLRILETKKNSFNVFQ